MRTTGEILNFGWRRIPLVGRASTAGELVTVAGWGHTWSRPGEQTRDPEFLQYLRKRIISPATCNQRMGRNIPASTICTEAPEGQGA